jgi:hypothetical protein
MMLATLIVLIQGCSSDPRPPSHATDSLLVVVLADLHLLEASRQIGTVDDSLTLAAANPAGAEVSPALPGDTFVLEASADRDSVLARHRLTEEEFLLAMRPYTTDPNRYVTLYDRVLDLLSQRAQEFYSREE